MLNCGKQHANGGDWCDWSYCFQNCSNLMNIDLSGIVVEDGTNLHLTSAFERLYKTRRSKNANL